jgi:3alpha(or 20beta)-hydroxysteroid dehydrogenase
MGAAHARAFVAEGAKVIMTDAQQEKGSALACELGGDALFIRHDVTDWDGWRKVVQEGEAKYGTINVLVNNAGITGKYVSTLEIEMKEYERVIAVNQTSIFYGTRAVLPSMLKAGGGSIVNISSICGMVAVYGSPSIAYVGSKFAVRGMTKMIAVEYGDKNIRANSVHPGFIRTPMLVNDGMGEFDEKALSQIPLKRIAEPSEVSNLVVFLASDESSFVSGMEHVIDGGMTAI